jgi:hypothetical protein
MVSVLTFDAETFLALPINERVQLCKQLAQRAQALADAADPKFRESYLDIAKNWLKLAPKWKALGQWNMQNKPPRFALRDSAVPTC